MAKAQWLIPDNLESLSQEKGPLMSDVRKQNTDQVSWRLSCDISHHPAQVSRGLMVVRPHSDQYGQFRGLWRNREAHFQKELLRGRGKRLRVLGCSRVPPQNSGLEHLTINGNIGVPRGPAVGLMPARPSEPRGSWQGSCQCQESQRKEP